MKKTLLKSLIAITFISVFVFITYQSKATILKKSDLSISTGLPDSLMVIFKRACVECHADGGNVMAESKVNFSKWNDYDSQKQGHKANKICEVLTEEKMPLKSWRKNNEKLIPTKKEVDSICKWAASLNTEK
jgi:hypothetical protein